MRKIRRILEKWFMPDSKESGMQPSRSFTEVSKGTEIISKLRGIRVTKTYRGSFTLDVESGGTVWMTKRELIDLHSILEEFIENVEFVEKGTK